MDEPRGEGVPLSRFRKPAWLVRAQHGWPAGYPVAQFPNAPLAIALAAAVAGRLVDGRAEGYASAAFHVALSIWAYEELAHGANAVRRATGAAGLAYVLASLAAELD
ncbi:MAG TPA: hypothetical protein VF715_07205 [Thermoleophilaceae bacterium]